MAIFKDGKFKFVFSVSVYVDIQFEILGGNENQSLILGDTYNICVKKQYSLRYLFRSYYLWSEEKLLCTNRKDVFR